MESKRVEVGPAFRFAWETLTKDFWYFIGLTVVMAVVSGVTGGWGRNHVYINIIGPVVSAWLTGGILRIVFDYIDGKKRELTDIFTQVQYFWKILLTNIILGVIIMVGFIFFIIPGIYLAMRFQFTQYFIVDKNLDIGEAMTRSTQLTQGIKLPLSVFALAIVGVMILGAIALGVGVLVAMPLVWLAHVRLYRTLLAEPATATVPPTDKPQPAQ